MHLQRDAADELVAPARSAHQPDALDACHVDNPVVDVAFGAADDPVTARPLARATRVQPDEP